MSATIEQDTTPAPRLIGEAPPSPSGPAPEDGAPLNLPPALDGSRALTAVRVSVRQIPLLFRARRELGDTFALRVPERPRNSDERIYFLSHPDHVKSLFTNPDLAPSATSDSPLRPIVGPNSVLTTIGPAHMRQRKLLLPPFHGEAVERYTQMIADVAEREIGAWPLHEPFALGPRMQSITLDVIMAGIFGVPDGRPAPGTPEHGLRRMILRLSWLTATPVGMAAELMNAGRAEPVGLTKRLLARLDRYLYATIAAARARDDAQERTDILSLLLAARDEDGRPMSDAELRDELLTLVLAGHETTANSLAWTFERLLRNPAAYDRLRESVRAQEAEDDGWLEATIHETMRNRPVVPIIGRRVQVPWQLGEHRVPAKSLTLVSIALLHHREDVYPDPFNFRPERFLGVRPGTYTWIPFGGGIRRCLGATLAMAEQRVVLRAIARRTDMVAPDPRPERVLNRNVTMIPARGARVLVTSRQP
ncbi:MAG: cytochrome P450 [Actinobacteria bacterium]|nr:cytochrome P450 [Actinomycetota bacterium]